ncbi:MAG: hypothetical protein ABI169_05195 [Chitinophagaceae bacterium]
MGDGTNELLKRNLNEHFSRTKDMINSKPPFLLINPSGEHLTPEKLCSLSGQTHTHEEAWRIIDTLKALAGIILRSCRISGTQIDVQLTSASPNQPHQSISPAA